MAFALVGSIGTVNTGNPTATPTFAQATTAGNLLVAWAVGWSSISGAITCSDGTWTKAVGAGAVADATIWYKANCGAGETAPTFTKTGGAVTGTSAALAEFSGGATSSPLDKTRVGGSSSSTSPMVVSATAADTAALQLFLTCCEWFLTKAGTCNTVDTYNNGATPSGNLNNDVTSTTNHYRFAYGITTGNSAADQTSETNDSMNISLGRGVIASFLLAAPVVRATFANPTNFQDPGIF